MRELDKKGHGNSEEGKINSYSGETRKGSREDMALKLKLKESLGFSKEAPMTSTKLNTTEKEVKHGCVVFSHVRLFSNLSLQMVTFLRHRTVK